MAFRSLIFAAVFAPVFKALTGFYHLQKGEERPCTKYTFGTHVKG
jgi:hypothetical protein